MMFRSKSLIPVLGLALLPAVFAIDKDAGRFKPGPANSYPNHQTSDKVTIAAVPFDTVEKAREAFGKTDLSRLGVMPVLIVIQNDMGKSLRLEQLQVELIGPDRQRIEATPAEDVRYLGGGKRPSQAKVPYPIPGLGKKKNPYEASEIQSRAFSARMLPPGDSAYGFIYFQGILRPGSLIYISGLKEAGTERDLLYFEIPVEPSR
jgi:hypothetical protein